MRIAAGLALAGVLFASGCDGAADTAPACPKPIHYDRATLDKIQAAIEKLPRDSILHQVLTDYENERDDLRFCK
jgi:hypothetical protein